MVFTSTTRIWFFFQTKEEIKMVEKCERDRLTLQGHGRVLFSTLCVGISLFPLHSLSGCTSRLYGLPIGPLKH